MNIPGQNPETVNRTLFRNQDFFVINAFSCASEAPDFFNNAGRETSGSVF
jgi:hypothetical protein